MLSQFKQHATTQLTEWARGVQLSCSALQTHETTLVSVKIQEIVRLPLSVKSFDTHARQIIVVLILSVLCDR